jgi:hypothetical protein
LISWKNFVNKRSFGLSGNYTMDRDAKDKYTQSIETKELKDFFDWSVLETEKAMKIFEHTYKSYKQIPEYIELRGVLKYQKGLRDGLI